MKIHRIVFLTPLALSLFVTMACKNTVEPVQEEHDGIIYLNSFESPADTAGWWGYGMIAFRDDVPPEGGNQSLFVAGGCIIPHAQVDLAPLEDDGYLLLRCWGKNLAIGGGASLEWFDEEHEQYKSIHIGISDSVWTTYESKDTLFCPAGKSLRLHLHAGGIVSSAILVDLVEIIKVE